MRVVRRSLLATLACVVALAAPAARADIATLPDYSARRLGESAEVDFATLKGKPLLVNTFATWCGPCRAEMPGIEALHAQYAARGLVVVGVNVDEGSADDAVVDYARELQLGFTVLRDPANRFAKRFRVLGVPETLLFDRDGTLVHRWRGAFDTHAAENLKRIESVLAPAPAATPAGPPPAAGLVQRGRRLAQQRGCTACHATDATPGAGPGWGGLAGTTAQLADGRSVMRDAAYLGRAIADPDADIVAGYARGVMAAAIPGNPLGADDIAALVAYIQSLGAQP